MIREIFGYGFWIVLVILIGMGFYIWNSYGKDNKLWKAGAIILWVLAALALLSQIIDAQKP